jgi:hypothetical protein
LSPFLRFFEFRRAVELTPTIQSEEPVPNSLIGSAGQSPKSHIRGRIAAYNQEMPLSIGAADSKKAGTRPAFSNSAVAKIRTSKSAGRPSGS